ncbi:N-6 DNA methylase [Rhizohabitans arisaemae]|uniref:N-6 DNA methylase n=1 Tax=Rhizohabitans arisaemae TaxID=2720610 RepID=UPI0024B1FCDE|nr:N-6 DNA methylase [Rhizohabitans arisaemae]
MGRDIQVTAADVARLAGVGRAAVSNWRRRHDDFPQPAGGTATSPSFSYADIRRWLQAHGESKTFPEREWLWQELRLIVEEDDLPALIADLGVFLLFLRREAGAWRRLAAKDDTELARLLPERIRGTCTGFAFPADLGIAEAGLMRRVGELAGDQGVLETFEFLRRRYFELHSRRVYTTPGEVVTLMLDLLGDDVGSVLDPACGSGSYLIGAHDRFTGVTLKGQDADHAVAGLTAVRLALHGADSDLRCGDSLRADAFPQASVDAVVGNPPFNDRNWGYDELTADPRWEYGLPPRMESELAWVQHALARLNPGGTAALLMPPAVANRKSGRRIRTQLLRRGALRAVIALPTGSIPNTAVALTVWVLVKPGDGPAPGHVLMVDTSDRDDYADLAVGSWRAFREGRPLDETVSRGVPLIDLLDDEVDLTPGRHLSTVGEAPSAEQVTGVTGELTKLLGVVGDLIPTVDADSRSLPLVPVSELVRRGMLTLLQQTPVRPGEGSDVPDGTRVLTARDVVEGRPASGTSPEHAVGRAIVVQPGDVVVPQVVRTLVATVVTEGGAVAGSHLSVLRPDPAQLDPDFLAGFLCGSENLREYSSLSSQYRVEVRRARIPLLPFDEQRRYGTAFRRLSAFHAALREATALGETLAQRIADGLTHGTVTPPGEKDDTGRIDEKARRKATRQH